MHIFHTVEHKNRGVNMPKMPVSQIVFGKTDAFNELSTFGQEYFVNSFVSNPKYHIDDFISGSRFFICGKKGTGKSALLKYLECYFEKDKANLVFPIRFKTEIEQVDKDNFEAVVSSSNDSTNEMRYDTDSILDQSSYVLVWKTFLINQIITRASSGYNPLVTGYEIKDRFIAGNVIEKAERIEAWMGENPESERMPEVKQALEALKDAEPPRIAFEDLDFNFGERWIPTGVYAAYMSRLFDTEVKIAYSASMDEFSVVCGYRTMKITDEFLVKGYYRNYDGMHLLKHALHNTCPDMMKSIGKDEHGNDIKVRDSEGIQLANAKIDEIRNGFSEWLEEQSPQFKERLTTMYNRKFNCFVRPKYDGSHQTFPDLNLKGLASRGIRSVYPSQMDCVWMLKQNGGGICDHEVGTGKTLIMCIAAHEMKRLNLAHKPMIIGLKANVAEIAATYQASSSLVFLSLFKEINPLTTHSFLFESFVLRPTL